MIFEVGFERDHFNYLLALVWSAWRLLTGSITYGDVTLMLAMIARVRSAGAVLTGVIPRWASVTASCDRIMELEALPRQPDPDREKVRALYSSLTGFTAEHLTFFCNLDAKMMSRDHSRLKFHMSFSSPNRSISHAVMRLLVS